MLPGERDVGDEARCGRPDDDAGDQIAHQRWNLQVRCNEAHQQCEAQRGCDRGDQADVTGHGARGDAGGGFYKNLSGGGVFRRTYLRRSNRRANGIRIVSRSPSMEDN